MTPLDPEETTVTTVTTMTTMTTTINVPMATRSLRQLCIDHTYRPGNKVPIGMLSDFDGVDALARQLADEKELDAAWFLRGALDHAHGRLDADAMAGEHAWSYRAGTKAVTPSCP